jgi:hypothetical protein
MYDSDKREIPKTAALVVAWPVRLSQCVPLSDPFLFVIKYLPLGDAQAVHDAAPTPMCLCVCVCVLGRSFSNDFFGMPMCS